MVCANPDCRLESSYLRGGSLYCIDVPPRPGHSALRRLIWLCSACARRFTVETWRPPGSQLRPLPHSSEGPALHPSAVSADFSGQPPLPGHRPRYSAAAGAL